MHALRRTVALLCLSGLLPIVVLGASFSAATLINERSVLTAAVEGRTRYAAALIGRELAADKRATNMMAQAPAFDDGFAADRFARFAERLIASEPGWRRIRVSDLSMTTLLEVPALAGAPRKNGVIDTDSFRWAVEHRRPDIGRVVAGPGGAYAFPVRAPVVRQGTVKFVVTTVVPASTLRSLLLDQNLPTAWRADIVDGNGIVVASTDEGAEVVGRSAAHAALRARRSGEAHPYSVERSAGVSEIAVWAPIAATNWTVHIGAPSRLFSDLWKRAVMLIAIATLISLLLLLLLVRLLLRDLSQSRLRDTAASETSRMESLGRLTGGVAHDFNNLLTPILGGYELLKRRINDDPKALKYIDAGIQSAERAKALVGRLLAYSRRQSLAPRAVDVERMLGDLADLLHRSVEPAVSISVTVAPDLPAAVADANQLELAIVNLVINARDAMPNGGHITIDAISGRGEQLDLPSGQFVGIIVSDAGVGMDPATLRNATEPFFTTKAADRGTGLGLSMVQGFAAQSGGALRLASKPGEGTRATIWLPASSDPAVEPAVKAHLEAGLVQADRRILLVDDEADVRSIAAEALRHQGVDVVEANSLRDAVETLQNDENGFDLLVTDYLMPGGTGVELIHRTRKSHPQLKALLVSGYIEQVRELPADLPRLQKPYSIDTLCALVNDLLRRPDR